MTMLETKDRDGAEVAVWHFGLRVNGRLVKVSLDAEKIRGLARHVAVLNPQSRGVRSGPVTVSVTRPGLRRRATVTP